VVLDAFVRSFTINRGSPYALFLGAGASISSGVLSANQCIWEWKRSIFLSQHPGLEQQFSELSLAGVRDRIQGWLDSTNCHPQHGDPAEYAHYIEQCYPIEQDRRRYFQDKIQHVTPHVGYRLLCFLADLHIVRSVWTTNFDGLTAKAAVHASIDPIEVGIDSAQARLPRQPHDRELLCVSLHGDYRYDRLKNTEAELQEQDVHLRQELMSTLTATSCICVGYSGRDASVMEALTAAYTRSGTGVLYWCTYGDAQPPEMVDELIRTARDSGREAYVVPASGFDDLMVRLARHVASETERDSISHILDDFTESHRLDRSVFNVPDYPADTVIKSNAFGIDCPGEVYEFGLKQWPESHVWQWLRELTRGHKVVTVPLRGQVLAVGLLDEIQTIFGDNIDGRIQRTPLHDSEYRYERGAVVSMMTAALAQGFAADAGVSTDGRRMLWNTQSMGTDSRSSQRVRIYDAVELSMRRMGSETHLVFKPTLHLELDDGSRPDRDLRQRILFDRLGRQWNSQFNDAVNQWRERLLGKGSGSKDLEFPVDAASTFSFHIRRAPVFAEVGNPGRQHPVNLSNMAPNLLRQRGVTIAEPELLFARRDGKGTVTDTHPIRGMLSNRPYDVSLTRKGLDQAVRVAVICPAQEQKTLSGYLHQVRRQHQKRSKDVYLLDFPGFDQAYGLPVHLPEPGSAGWQVCPEPQGQSAEECARSLGQAITRATKQLQAAVAPDAVIIYIPDRWQWYRGYLTDSERFDVHDYVKAFCVQRGVATQFLNESTLRDTDQCRVWWWLSLALYVKSMRTPWVLNGMESDTAFVGIGYSVDRLRGTGQHVVLGCSHIYSASGEGLQYRLSKVEQPRIIRGNPFMSEDDARRLGETIRSMFYDSRFALPRRVVLHKRTEFKREEREGLGQGLAGVSEIDMVEISLDRALRYVASGIRNGKPAVDRYPVRRGTTIMVDDYAALTWVHGVTEAVDTGRKHFQGGRRIPTPLMLKRHAGHTPLEKLAFEIMGLSKMDWNSFDMYTKLPATLQSSGEIAKIGVLLERFGTASYDYRLFM